MPETSHLIVTAGEPAGIGPDLVVQCAAHAGLLDAVVIADAEIVQRRAAQLKVPLRLLSYPEQATQQGELSIIHRAAATPTVCGVPDSHNSPYVIDCIAEAADRCQQKEFTALVTAPVNKAVINAAGILFSGHTEYLAQRLNVSQVVMMLMTETLRVALVTTHMPLREVSSAITAKRLTCSLQILHTALKHTFLIAAPRILVCGLNPHAGENGYLGDEEQTIITPVLNALRLEGIDVRGPLPADTLFLPKNLRDADAVMAMYHDQGLPVLKFAGFGQACNITLGLPIIRTSVDHGTAFDLAGTGRADTGSFMQALKVARQLGRR